jgi:hypothetical protein
MTKIPAANVKLKRAYESPAATDGTRILIDRLWPRGISKQKAALDQWMKEIAPSTKLRKWFGHDSSGQSLSALPAKGDIRQRIEYVCLVPQADVLDEAIVCAVWASCTR